MLQQAAHKASQYDGYRFCLQSSRVRDRLKGRVTEPKFLIYYSKFLLFQNPCYMFQLTLPKIQTDST